MPKNAISVFQVFETVYICTWNNIYPVIHNDDLIPLELWIVS